MNTEDDEFKRIEREATRGIPDPIHHTDTSESLEYITGWNDCRQAMLAAQQEPMAWLFQHEETGLTQCVDIQQVEWGFEKNNLRWQKIAPLYTTPQAPKENQS